MTARILRFRPRRRACDLCGLSFNPTKVSTHLCHKCWSWTMVAVLQRRMTMLIEGSRE